MSFAVTGSFEEIAELVFGPAQHNAHVKARNVHRLYVRYTGNFDARMAEMMAEGRRLAAQSKPQTQFLEAAE